MKTVKYVCKKCQHAEEYTTKELIVKQIKNLIASIIIILGITTLMLLIIAGPINTFNTISTLMITNQYNHYDKQSMRTTAITMTDECRTKGINNTNSLCNAEAIYKQLKNISYITASKYQPMNNLEDTLKYGGDCKNTALLYTTLMQNLGFNAMVDCNIKEKHCISVIPYTDYEEYQNINIIVDLTIPGIYLLKSDEKIWDYKKIGAKLWI